MKTSKCKSNKTRRRRDDVANRIN